MERDTGSEKSTLGRSTLDGLRQTGEESGGTGGPHVDESSASGFSFVSGATGGSPGRVEAHESGSGQGGARDRSTIEKPSRD